MQLPRQTKLKWTVGSTTGYNYLLYQVAMFAVQWWKGFSHNNCKVEAAALTFFTLLALVPALVLLAKLVSIIPEAAADIEDARQYFFQLLLPESAESLHQYLALFSARANHITLAGIPMLMASVLGLMLQLQKTLTRIFVMQSRSLLFKVLFCILALVFGPFVLSLLLSLSVWIKQLAIIGWIPWGLGTELISFVIQGVIASGFFILLPARRLPLRLALLGGILLVAAQNGLQFGFSTMLAGIGNYQVIYGIFAAIPLFLLWIYFCWTLVLAIAVLLQTITTFRHSSRGSAT